MTPKEKAYELIEKHLKVYNIEPIAVEQAFVSVEFAKEFITGDLSESFDKYLYLQDVNEEIEIYLEKWEQNEL